MLKTYQSILTFTCADCGKKYKKMFNERKVCPKCGSTSFTGFKENKSCYICKYFESGAWLFPKGHCNLNQIDCGREMFCESFRETKGTKQCQ